MNEKTRVHITGLSQRGDEMRAEHLLRQNKKTAPHQHPMHEHSKPKLSGGGVKLPVRPGQAGAVTYQGKGTYTYGDGDPGAKAGVRPGADDHLQFKSLEDKGTVVYRDRGHK